MVESEAKCMQAKADTEAKVAMAQSRRDCLGRGRFNKFVLGLFAPRVRGDQTGGRARLVGRGKSDR